MARYGDMNFAWWTKNGFLFSLTLLLIGAGGELLSANMGWSLPAWETTLLFDLEILGILGILLVPFVFGIFLPLTD